MMKLRLRAIVTILLVLVLALSVTGAALAAPGGQGTVRVWVGYGSGRSAQAWQALAGSGATLRYHFTDLEAYVVTLPAAALAGIEHNPNVLYVEEDAERYPIATMPSAVTGAVQAASVISPQQVPYGIDMVQARDVWDADRNGAVDAGAPTGSNRTLCIIDSGLYTGHEDFQGVTASGYSGNLPWNQDGFGHGTHVAGSIAAVNNSFGVVGVTPGTVKLYIVRVFGDDGAWAYSSDLVNALSQCRAAGANVVSMSLGGSRSIRAEKTAFATAYSAGVLSVAAAGNAGTSAYSYPGSYDSVISVAAIYENKVVADFSQYNSQVELAAPGVGVLSAVPYLETNTLTACGVTYAANHIEYSARGTASGALVNGGLCTATGAWGGKVVLCQRGDNSFYEKVMNVQNSGGAAAIIYNNEPGTFLGTLGEGYSSTIVAISLSQEDGQYLVASRLGESGTVSSSVSKPGSGYEAWDGTSMATPHVSAVAALIWSANPGWTNAQIRTALQQAAQDLGAAGRDAYYGYGLVQAKAALDLLRGTQPVNEAPVVSLTSPANGASYDSGATIPFSGTVTDEDAGLAGSLAWTSSLDGPIGTGASFSTALLSVGTHTITAAVTDSGGLTGLASISVTVNPAATNTAPAASITSPANGATYDSGASIPFTGSATDAEDGDLSGSLGWTSSLDGPIGTGASFSRVLSAGTHTITAAVTDSGGLTGLASIVVTVNPAATNTITVATLTGTSASVNRNLWRATATATVNPALAGAVVSGTWSTGGTATCTTGSAGTCSVSTNLKTKSYASTQFTITGVVLAGYTYDASGSVTTVTISKP